VVGCLLTTFLNGLVVGYGVLWFQLFGDRPDRDDYLMSFGGYAAATLVLVVGLASLVRLRTAGWAVGLVGVLAGVLALLALNSLATGLGMTDDSGVYQHWWDGAGGVLLLPWAWVPLVLGGLAVLGRGPRRAARIG
jgi:hypothetical protein